MSTNVCGLRSTSGNQRALHLHHDPVPGAEGVVDVRQREPHRASARPARTARASRSCCGTCRASRRRARAAGSRPCCTPGRVRVGVGVVVGIDVDQLDDPVGVGPGRRDVQRRPRSARRRSRRRSRARRSGRRARRAARGEPLVADHVLGGHADGDLVEERHRLGRIADVLVGRLGLDPAGGLEGELAAGVEVERPSASASFGGQASYCRHWFVPVSKTYASGSFGVRSCPSGGTRRTGARSARGRTRPSWR